MKARPATTMPPPQVSVILPTHNRAHSLRRAVQSVLRQSFSDFELIVVDDASTDGSTELLAGINDARLRCLRLSKRLGAAAARNRGIAQARADLIAFQDSDDEWLPDKLLRQVQQLNASEPEVGLTYCALLRWDRHFVERVPAAGEMAPEHGEARQLVLRRNLAPTPAWLVRRSSFEKVGLFDESLPALEDWDWMMRFLSHYQTISVEEPLLIANESADSLSLNHGLWAVALPAMIAKHEQIHGPRIRAGLAYLHYLMGLRQCLLNECRLGRRSLRRALALNPADGKTWTALLLSFFGAGALYKVWLFNRRLRAIRGARRSTGVA